MNRNLYPILLTLLTLSTAPARSQNLNGQWSGGFISRGDLWGNKTEYVLELDVRERQVSGYSYTYFIISGKRHYVICRLQGNFEKGSKSIVVNEVEKVKSNTPPDFQDMFQTHMLTYMRQGDKEMLQGRWKPYDKKVPQEGGETTLERRVLAKVKTTDSQKPVAQNKPTSTPKPQLGTRPNTGTPSTTTAPKPPVTAKGETPKPTANNPTPAGTGNSQPAKPATPVTAQTGKPAPTPVPTKDRPTDEQPARRTDPEAKATPQPSTAEIPKLPSRIEQRSKTTVQVIEVDEPNFRVELYDNGQIDGDTVSLYFNNRLMVSRKRLSTTPITLDITLDERAKDNELVMFAENMGSIPPNTALMVVTVKDKRYEVNITSTEQANGSVRFRLKE